MPRVSRYRVTPLWCASNTLPFLNANIAMLNDAINLDSLVDSVHCAQKSDPISPAVLPAIRTSRLLLEPRVEAGSAHVDILDS